MSLNKIPCFGGSQAVHFRAPLNSAKFTIYEKNEHIYPTLEYSSGKYVYTNPESLEFSEDGKIK